MLTHYSSKSADDQFGMDRQSKAVRFMPYLPLPPQRPEELHQSQAHQVAKAGWTCPYQSKSGTVYWF